jgi:hypothetical protein
MKISIQTWLGPTGIFEELGYATLRGKQLYDVIMKEFPALNKNSGKSVQRQLLHVFTEYAVERSISNLPGIRYEEKWNGRSYHFLELNGQRFTMTTSLIRNGNTVPRTALYRCTRAMQNQNLLFPDLETQLSEGSPYFIFTHGLMIIKAENEVKIEELFCGIGMPNTDDPRRWEDFLSLNEYIKPHETPEEAIGERELETLLKIKEQVINGSA